MPLEQGYAPAGCALVRAQAGVLIKNAEALERMQKIDTLVVDKTGTLTEGKPKVVAIVRSAVMLQTPMSFAAASSAPSIQRGQRTSP